MQPPEVELLLLCQSNWRKSLNCPSCGRVISWLKIRGSFKCPYCYVAIETNFYNTAITVAFLLWFFFSVSIHFYIDSFVIAFILDITVGPLGAIMLMRGILLIGNKKD